MAISATNIVLGSNAIAGSIQYNIWGTVYTPATNVYLSNACATANAVGNDIYVATTLGGLVPSFSRTPTSLSWTTGVYGDKTITVTANVAWTVSISGSSNFTVYAVAGSVTLSGSGSTAVVGGNGTITIRRSPNAGSYSGTVTITYCNGTGGSTTAAVTLNAT